MSFRDQQKYLNTLKRYEKKMDSKELESFKMFVKRDKDEEELDNISMHKLKELYEKYHLNRERKNFDHFFKKSEKQ